MKIEINRRTYQLEWYSQDLISTSLDSIYGQELLTRAIDVETRELANTGQLFNYLDTQDKLTLAIVERQLDDFFIAKRMLHLIKQSMWINISGQLLSKDGMFEQLWHSSLQNIDANIRQKLVLEICENSIDSSKMIERIQFLQEQGFRVAMDDFGAGHSNLNRLSQVNFDFIKLDLNLIKKVPEDLWSTSLYRQVIGLCSSKGSLIVAEGVETKVQSDFVRWSGVNIIQGFLYSKPRPLISTI